jgi:hypothetical protein
VPHHQIVGVDADRVDDLQHDEREPKAHQRPHRRAIQTEVRQEPDGPPGQGRARQLARHQAAHQSPHAQPRESERDRHARSCQPPADLDRRAPAKSQIALQHGVLHLSQTPDQQIDEQHPEDVFMGGQTEERGDGGCEEHAQPGERDRDDEIQGECRLDPVGDPPLLLVYQRGADTQIEYHIEEDQHRHGVGHDAEVVRREQSCEHDGADENEELAAAEGERRPGEAPDRAAGKGLGLGVLARGPLVRRVHFGPRKGQPPERGAAGRRTVTCTEGTLSREARRAVREASRNAREWREMLRDAASVLR